ncbi:hypothetical protein HAX54_010319, partial [Datura stramonium]|nr:hypothetical protein [Datura stramonium]
ETRCMMGTAGLQMHRQPDTWSCAARIQPTAASSAVRQDAATCGASLHCVSSTMEGSP